MNDAEINEPGTSDALALAQAMRLASPALPVGGFSYSQGLEWAVEAGWVTDEASAQAWIVDGLMLTLARFELPLLARLLRADDAGRTALDNAYLAAREAREPREESLRMGHALKAMLAVLPEMETGSAVGAVPAGCAALSRPTVCATPASWPVVFAEACNALNIPEPIALTAYAMSWGENQIAAAVKLVPLGQSAAQRILSALIAELPAALREADARAADFSADAPLSGLETSLPALAVACAQHETQYTRLFRS